VYNYYSDGDEVFEEENSVPTKYGRIFHWPTFKSSWPFVETSGMLTPARCAWQKQEVLKGIDLLFGTLDGGWGFHCWRRTIGHNMHRTVHYSSSQANAMVQDGSIVQNPVFDRGESAMFNATISESDINHILAYNIPAVSSATGIRRLSSDCPVAGNYNLNTLDFKSNQWGRNLPVYLQRWLHSDVKNMTFQCVYKLFEDIVTKGVLK
jgi:hypothetical protein